MRNDLVSLQDFYRSTMSSGTIWKSFLEQIGEPSRGWSKHRLVSIGDIAMGVGVYYALRASGKHCGQIFDAKTIKEIIKPVVDRAAIKATKTKDTVSSIAARKVENWFFDDIVIGGSPWRAGVNAAGALQESMWVKPDTSVSDCASVARAILAISPKFALSGNYQMATADAR